MIGCSLITAALVATAMASAAPAAVKAAFLDGHALKALADASDRSDTDAAERRDFYQGAKLSGYVTGVADAQDWACYPERVNTGQLIDTVKTYLRNHPEQWDGAADMIVRRAIIQAFPCAA